MQGQSLACRAPRSCYRQALLLISVCSGPKYGSSSRVRAPKKSISLPPSNLPDARRRLRHSVIARIGAEPVPVQIITMWLRGWFGIRLAPELSGPRGHMRNSNGAEGEKAIWGKPADWVDYEGMISGQRAGIAVFDSPTSFRHPTTWHARAYGLFAANPFGLREFSGDPNKDGSWSVPEGKSVTFRYRVLIHEGEFGPTEINAAYHKYASEKK